MRIRHDTLATVFNTVYVALMANVLLVVGALPLVAGVLLTDPSRSWPLLALVAPLCAPALCGVFAVLREFSTDGYTAVLRTFGRAWRASWRRATALGALSCGALVVLAVDIRALWGHRVGAVAIPVLVVLIVLVISTALLGFVALAERPGAPLRTVLRVCAYVAVRRWYLTAASLVLLAVLVQIIAARPAIGLGLAAAPVLYVVWANSRFALRPALHPPPLPA